MYLKIKHLSNQTSPEAEEVLMKIPFCLAGPSFKCRSISTNSRKVTWVIY